MHITFQINRIISVRVLYKGDFKNVFRENEIKYNNMFKVT